MWMVSFYDYLRIRWGILLVENVKKSEYCVGFCLALRLVASDAFSVSLKQCASNRASLAPNFAGL